MYFFRIQSKKKRFENAGIYKVDEGIFDCDEFVGHMRS